MQCTALRNTHGNKSLMMFKAILHKSYSAEIETKTERDGVGRREKVELKV